MKTTKQLIDPNTVKLIQSLQTHQIELELQNQELLRTTLEAQEAAPKYAEWYEFAPSGYFTLSTDGSILELNLTGSQMLGKEQKQLVNSRFGLFVSEESKPIFGDFIESVFRSGMKETCEVTLEIENLFPLEVQLTGIVTGTGDRCLLTAIDITARKKEMDELKRSQILMRSSLESQKGMILLSIDSNYRYLYFNKAHRELIKLAYSQEIELGMNILEVIPSGAERDLIKAHFDQALKGESHTRVWTFNHEPLNFYESYFDPILNDQLEIVGTTAISRNIINKKKAEKLLGESKTRLDKTQEMAHLGSWEFDLQSGHLFWSDEVYRIFGLLPQEFAATHQAFLESVHPEDRDRLNKTYFGSVEENKPGYELEHRVIRRHTGEIRYVFEKCEHIRDTSGVIVRSLGMVQDITERKNAENALRANEMKFRSYIENAPDCIFIIDDHSHYLEVNSAVSTTLGYSSDEMLKLTLRDLIVEESLKDGRDHYKKLKESGQAVADLLIKHKNGSKVWLTINAVKLSSKLFLCFGKDITEQKQTEEALIASEEKFRSFIRFSSDPIFSFNRDGTYRFVNNIYASTLGKYPQEIIGKTRFDFFPPDEAESGMALVWKVFQTGEKGEREARIIIHTGEVRYFLTIVDPFKNELGEVLYVNCIAKDITALKKTELALRESEAQINALLAAVPDMIFVLDLQGVFLDYHGPLTAELYVSPEEFIGRNIQDILPPEIARQFEIAFKAAIQTGEIQVCTYSLPMPDGLNYYEAKVVTYAGSKFLTSIRNVTLHKKSEELIRQKNWDLEKINAEKDKFFSIIAHDLRSPFSGFLGLTETLVRRLPDMTLKEIQEITLLMRKSAVYLFRLLGNLLEWSRMQRGLITFAPKSFLMSPKIIQNINLIKELAQLKGIEIHFRNDEDLMIFADENMFDSIVRNLVSNAVKYTRKGGSITVSAHNGPDGTVEISIKDTGIGMNPLLLNQLFRLDIQSNRNGTGGEYSSGLGLIICKDFIEKHGGKLEIESAEGVGSTFRFSLPAVNCH